MSTLVFLGLPNVVSRKSCIVTPGGPEPVSGESANLKNDEPSQTARISTRDPKKSFWDLNWYGDSFTYQAAVIINHNLAPNDYWRIVGSNTAQAYIQLDPTSFSATSNITGAVSNLVTTDLSTNPGSYVEPTSELIDAYFECDFNQQAFNSTLGEAMACVCIGVRHFLNQSTTYCPTIEVELREGANLIRNLGRKAVIPDFTYRIMVFPFNPAELVLSTNLDNVRVRIYIHPGDNSTAKVDSLLIYYNSSIVTSIDTGWKQTKQGMDFASIRDGILPTKSDHNIYSSSVANVDSIRLMTLGDGMELNPPGAVRYGVPYTNSALVYALSIPLPDTFIEIGLPIIGEKLVVDPGLTTDFQTKYGTETTLNGGNTLAGIAYGADAYTKRTIPDRLDLICSRDDMMKLMIRIGWQKGNSGTFYIIIDSDLDNKYQLLSAMPVVCTNITSNLIEIGRSGSSNRGDDKFLVSLQLEEKL